MAEIKLARPLSHSLRRSMSPKPSSKDIYDMVRSQTEHEDHLIDQRLTWP
jgi:hypothetical protein